MDDKTEIVNASVYEVRTPGLSVPTFRLQVSGPDVLVREYRLLASSYRGALKMATEYLKSWGYQPHGRWTEAGVRLFTSH